MFGYCSLEAQEIPGQPSQGEGFSQCTMNEVHTLPVHWALSHCPSLMYILKCKESMEQGSFKETCKYSPNPFGVCLRKLKTKKPEPETEVLGVGEERRVESKDQ